MKWFVILRGPSDLPLPMTADDDFLALFDTEGEAKKAAEANPYGRAYGFEVFSWQ